MAPPLDWLAVAGELLVLALGCRGHGRTTDRGPDERLTACLAAGACGLLAVGCLVAMPVTLATG